MKYIKSILTAFAGLLSVAHFCPGQTDADLAAFWDFESGRTGTDVWSTHLHGTAPTPNCYDTIGGIAFIDSKNQFFMDRFGEPTLAVRLAADEGVPAFDGAHLLRATVFNDEQAYLDYAASEGQSTEPHQSNVKARIDPGVPMGHLRVADGDEVWFGFAMYLPNDYVFDSKPWGTEGICELQYREDLPSGTSAKGGPFGLAIGNGKLYIGATYSPTDNPADADPADKRSATYNLTRGVWYAIVCHARFDHSSAATGFAEVWINGQKVMNEQGIRLGYAEMLGAKMGMDVMTNYKHNWFLDPSAAGYSSITPAQQFIRSIYYDALRVAKPGEGSFAMVDPLQAAGPVVGPPGLPVGILAVGGEGQIVLDWAVSPHATGYTVKRSTTAGGPYAIVAADMAPTHFVDNTVTAGVTYYYVVSASNALGESANSVEVSSVATENLNVAAPVFAPAGGVYNAAQNVTLATATAGASIRYTTDGTIPTSTIGNLYTGPIQVEVTTTLKAIAYKADMIDSPVRSETYLIEEPPPPSASIFHDDFESYAPGALPRANGEPSKWAESGAMVSTVETDVADRFGRGSANQILRLEDTGASNQAMGTNVFTIGTTGQISFEFNLPANFNSYTSVNAGLLLRIGTNPNAGTFTSGTTRFALGLHAGGTIKAADNLNQVLNGADLASFSFDEPHKLTLAFNNTASPVSYTTGGGVIPPDSMDVWLDGTLVGTMGYSNSSSGLAITTLYFLNRVNDDTCVAYIDEVNFSGVLSGGAEVTESPEFSPIPGSYSDAQSVQITSATIGAAIRYTTDGSEPTATTGMLYTGPINLAATTTLKAVAYKAGHLDSVVSVGDYTITTAPPPAAVFFDDFESYEPGVLPRANGAHALWAASGSITAEVESDAQNRFGRGTSNQVLRFEDTGSGDQRLGTNVFAIGTTGQVAFDFYLPTGFNSATGGHPGILLRLGTNTNNGIFTVASTRFALGFHASGVLKAANNANLVLFGDILGAFAFDEPQRLTLAFNNTSVPVPYLDGSGSIAPNSIDVWLDDVRLATVGAANSSSGEVITSLDFLNRVGNDTAVAYFDNVTFTTALTGGTASAAPAAAGPQFSPAGGAYIGTQQVTLTSASSGVSIRYTLDGSEPNETTGTLYAGPVPIAASAVLKAVAYGEGFMPSAVTAADYTINLPPTIVDAPADLTITAGDAATFAVAATGTGPLSYQWRKDGVPLVGAIDAVLNLPVALTADAGNYDVVVGNTAGTVTSSGALLTVNKAQAAVQIGGLSHTYDGAPHAATITTEPGSLTVNVTYAGAVDAPVDAGDYTVVATVEDDNFEGTATATLVIAQAPVSFTFDGLVQRYTGDPRVVTAGTHPAVDVVVSYDGELTPPSLPGEYVIEAVVDGNPNYTGSATDVLVVTVTALVRHGPALNGGLDGSLQVLRPENVTLNGNAWISGDLLIVGSPALQLNGGPLLAGTIEGPGAADPSTHRVTLNGQALLRHLVTRVDAIEPLAIAEPPTPEGTRNVVLNQASQSAGDFATLRNLTLNGNVGAIAIPAGTYGNFTANGSSSFTLGEADADERVVIDLQTLTLNGNSRLDIVGPVILTLANGGALNGSVGAEDHPEWLVLRVANGGITLNGNMEFHGTILAPNGTVSINGNSALHGTVEADRLVINGGGVLAEPQE